MSLESIKGEIMKKLFFMLTLLLFLSAQEINLNIAPDFSATDIDGNLINLDSLLTRGPVFITFWALWCKMCIKELDALKPYYDELDSLGVNLIAVNEDKARAVAQVKPFVKSKKWKYKFLLDPENTLRDLYNVLAMPTNFIIDQNKKIIFVHQGYKTGDEKLIVEKLLELFEEKQEDEPEE